MARSTSKRSALFLTIVAVRSGHGPENRTEAFPLLQRLKHSLLLHKSPLSRKSLLLPRIYHKRLSYQDSCHSVFRISLLSRNSKNGDEDDDYDDNELCDPTSGTIEDARHRFEEMISIPQENPQHQREASLQQQHQHKLVPPSRTIAYLTHQINSANILKANPPPPPLTTIFRERRISELKILNSLSSSDQAVNDLWSLWFTERGTKASKILLRAEELYSRAVGASGSGSSTSSGGSGATGSGEEDAQEAESLLWDLIEEHGVHWAEPMNRLATLMYMRGRLEESKALCEVVLSVKPWHIGALSGIVMVCMSMNDVGSAREWAEKRLPPLLLDSGDDTGDVICSRRRSWVTRATRDAKYQLIEKEERTTGDIAKQEAEFRSLRIRLQKMDEVNANSEVQGEGNDAVPCRGDDDGIWQ